MEGYHRNSLRELRRSEQEEQWETRKKGSRFITFLIILLFLFAGGFYLSTARPAWLTSRFDFSAVGQRLKDWKNEVLDAVKGTEDGDVQQTVDSALSGGDEAV